MIKKKLQGTGVAILTPFSKNQGVDFDALGRMLSHIVQGGVDYIVALGTTAESATLSTEEKKDILHYIAQHPEARKLPLVVGIGSNNTQEVERMFSVLPLENAVAIMSVSPYYNKPTQEGIFQHYNYLASATPKPIILYNVPARTSRNIEPSTVIRLAETCPMIQGIKEASDQVGQAVHLLKHCPQDFLLASGEDGVFMPLILSGFDSLISVAANVFPRAISTAVRACLSQKPAEARAALFAIYDTIPLMFEENNPAGIKAFLSELNLIQPYLRLPLVDVSEGLKKRIQHALKGIQTTA